VRAKEFEPHTVSKAIYATGWDGNVVIEGGADGNLTVVSTKSSPPSLGAAATSPGAAAATAARAADFHPKNDARGGFLSAERSADADPLHAAPPRRSGGL
jgi:hypothetical protein